MPLNLPKRLPAIELLKKESIFVIDNERASTQDIRPLRIAVVNLMPIKITTETDLIRLLSNSFAFVIIFSLSIISNGKASFDILLWKTISFTPPMPLRSGEAR